MDTAKIRMRCPVCGKKLTASPEKLGKLARCPHCADTIRIVSMPEKAPVAEAPATEAPPVPPMEQAETGEEAGEDVDAPEATPVEHEESVTAGALAPPAPAPPRRATPVVHAEEEETSLHDPGEDFGPVDVPVAAGGGLTRIAVILGFPILLVVGVLGGYMLGGLGDGNSVGNGNGKNQPDVPSNSVDDRRRQEDERAYLGNVQVVRFEVGRTDLREHALLGAVRNAGSQALEQVKIVVRCSNEGAPVEQELWVVDASASRVGNQAHPLRPGQTREFVMDLQDMSAAWGGAVQVEVTEVRFYKPDTPNAGG
jgi:hypothetical protein